MERKSMSKAKEGDTKRLSSVANAMRLLKAFSDEEYEIGLSQLAKQLNLAKSTVHRLASTLIGADMLEQTRETGKYRLGMALFEMGTLVRRQMDFSTEARPFLTMLRDTTGETVHLAILEHASIIYINYLASRQVIRMSTELGMRKPAYCTGEGKALMAFQSAESIEQIIRGGLAQRTVKTIIDPAALRKELAAIRTRGYAIDDEESEAGMRCIAAPVRDSAGKVIAATGVAGPTQRLTKKKLMAYAPDVIGAADAISQRLGYLPRRPA